MGLQKGQNNNKGKNKLIVKLYKQNGNPSKQKLNQFVLVFKVRLLLLLRKLSKDGKELAKQRKIAVHNCNNKANKLGILQMSLLPVQEIISMRNGQP